MAKLTIIIPAYNESRTIRRIVERCMEVNYPLDYEILVIDDYSRDRTYRIAKILEKRDLSRRIRLFRNDINRGKGHCIKRGIEEGTGDIMVVQDADYEYDPMEIPDLIKPIMSGEYDAVFGSRFKKNRRPEGMAFPNYVANVFLTFLTNLLYGMQLTDMETCYKVIRMKTVRSLGLKANRFDFEPEVTSKLGLSGVRILEIPISYHGRTASEGKKIKARDFFMAVDVLFRNRFLRVNPRP